MKKSEFFRLKNEYKKLPYIRKMTLSFSDFIMLKCEDDVSLTRLPSSLDSVVLADIPLPKFPIKEIKQDQKKPSIFKLK